MNDIERLKSTKKDRLKSNDSLKHLHRRKSHDYLFKPIVSTNDQRKSSSPFQTGLRYLKLLGQVKRQNENMTMNSNEIKSTLINRLERISAFSTNYYAPLPTNKSIQVDNFDELSYKTAINHNDSYISFYEFLFSFISLMIFMVVILYTQVNSYPIHCLIQKTFWYPIDLSNSFLCENTNIEIYYVEIYSIVYQFEIQKNLKAINCLGFDILSCLPINSLLIPKGYIIHRNNHLIKYCNSTKKIHCKNHSLNILPYEYKWNLKNNQINVLNHCSCLTFSNKTNDCFHFMIKNRCDLPIPWLNYCLKYSSTNSVCQAYVKNDVIIG